MMFLLCLQDKHLIISHHWHQSLCQVDVDIDSDVSHAIQLFYHGSSAESAAIIQKACDSGWKSTCTDNPVIYFGFPLSG
jgi:hypothetical protein